MYYCIAVAYRVYYRQRQGKGELAMDEKEFEDMTKEEMQRFLIKEAQRGSTEFEAYKNLMEILGIEFPKEKED